MAKKKPAKKPTVSKTQLIKGALAKSPNASPVEIAERLKKSGVTAQYVSTVKFNMKKKTDNGVAKKANKKAVRKIAKNRTKKAEASFTASELVKASRLAEELGGVDKAQELLQVISKLS